MLDLRQYQSMTANDINAAMDKFEVSMVEAMVEFCKLIYVADAMAVDTVLRTKSQPVLRHYREIVEEKLAPEAAWEFPTGSKDADTILTALMRLPLKRQRDLIAGEQVAFLRVKNTGELAERANTIHTMRASEVLCLIGPDGIRSIKDQRAYMATKPLPRVKAAADPARGIDPNKKATIRADALHNRLQIGDVYVTVDDLAPALAQLSPAEITRLQSTVMQMAFARNMVQQPVS